MRYSFIDIWSVFSEPFLPLLRDERIRDAQRKTPWQGEKDSFIFQILPCFKYREGNCVMEQITGI